MPNIKFALYDVCPDSNFPVNRLIVKQLGRNGDIDESGAHITMKGVAILSVLMSNLVNMFLLTLTSPHHHELMDLKINWAQVLTIITKTKCVAQQSIGGKRPPPPFFFGTQYLGSGGG